MPLRILCLHGIGTNSAILESQTVAFRSLLPPDYEWHFIDGEEDADPAPGIGDIFPGPYLCFYIEPCLGNLQSTLDLVEEIIEREGPFDAIMGFSQGGAVAASFILKHQLEKPFEPLPFRFAIFLCPSLPFSWDEKYGFDVTPLLVAGRSLTTDFAEWQCASVQRPRLCENAVHDLPPQIRRQIELRMRAGVETGTDVSEYRRFHPEAMKDRIRIPTVHVYGAQDEFRDQSLALLAMCEKSLTQVVEHGGGHEVPRDASQDIARAVRRAVARAEFMI